MRWCEWLLVSGCGELVEQIARRRPTTETKVAVGTDVVVAWQRSQRLVEHTSEQMAVGFDAVPSSAAATSLRQVVPPHSTASNRTVLVGCRHHPSASLQRHSHSTSMAAPATVACRRLAYSRVFSRHFQPQRSRTRTSMYGGME